MLIKKLAVSWPAEKCFPALDLLSDIAGLDFKIALDILPIENLLQGLDFSINMNRTSQIIAMLKLRCLANIISHRAATNLVMSKIDNVIYFMTLDSFTLKTDNKCTL